MTDRPIPPKEPPDPKDRFVERPNVFILPDGRKWRIGDPKPPFPPKKPPDPTRPQIAQ